MSFVRMALCLGLVLAISGLAWAAPVKLSVGDPAPALSVGTWLKGKPVARFQKDTIYVVEFWASWCPPCRESIPHLTELQKKYPAVVFMGIDIWERGAAAGPAFVKEMGDKMDYRVATDPTRLMARTWMDAAGEKGIPCAFVVDGEGLVAWIGFPTQLDGVLKRMTEPASDSKAALHVGSPAPKLTFGKWIKGEPVAGFVPGKAYVVEFWAASCPTLRDTIPHLTQLQRKYPAITFIGLNCSADSPAAVEAFVEKAGDKMGYRVAVDDPKQQMMRAWMQAAEQRMIPCAFVVGPDSKIAWFGYTMDIDMALVKIARANGATTRPSTQPVAMAP
jgi:thiol-disulfide isomerase/thioredoxin